MVVRRKRGLLTFSQLVRGRNCFKLLGEQQRGQDVEVYCASDPSEEDMEPRFMGLVMSL